jgi:hypothetical protein
MRMPSALKIYLIVAREISSVREQISIQRSPMRGIIRSFCNLSDVSRAALLFDAAIRFAK